MAETNGSHDSEKQHDRIWEVLTGLIDHAEMTDKRIEQLRQSQSETNVAVKDLTSAIRDLIDRIPPENLR